MRARRLSPLVQEGHASSLAEAAIRFAIAHKAMGSILVGMATFEEFEQSLAAVNKGPLTPAALSRLAQLQQGFAGDAGNPAEFGICCRRETAAATVYGRCNT